MGIDIQAVQVLQWAAAKTGVLGDVATLGRQGVYLSAQEWRRCGIPPLSSGESPYCEPLLMSVFGARRVDSFDKSPFEGCTVVADFNKPLEHDRQYDTILDLGCMEHIFNVPQALKNISGICREGGQILHCLPANNDCGHGFWQFSPELFFSVYSAANGYAETEVFLVDRQSPEPVWYKVLPPRDGQRVTIWSDVPLNVLCRTVRRGPFSHDDIQQSDYVFAWSNRDEPPIQQSVAKKEGRIKTAMKRVRAINSVYRGIVAGLGLRSNSLRRNRALVRRSVAGLIEDAARDSHTPRQE